MKKLLALLTVIIFVSTLGNSALAQNNPDSASTGNGHGFAKQNKEFRQNYKEKFRKKRQEIKNRLNLTEDQITKARQIREGARPEIKPIITQMRQKRQEIRDLKQSGASREEIRAKIDEIRALRKQANEIRKKNIQKFESILTPEQKIEFDKIKQEMKQKRQEMRQKRREYRQNHKN